MRETDTTDPDIQTIQTEEEPAVQTPTFDPRVEGIDRRVAALEQRMASMDAHLERILDEAKRTNEILSSERDDRRAREAAEVEAAKDRRVFVARVAQELWAILRQPLGLAIAASIAYFTWRYLSIPPTPGPVPVRVVEPAPAPVEAPSPIPEPEQP